MTNVLMLETAVAGEWILLANRREVCRLLWPQPMTSDAPGGSAPRVVELARTDRDPTAAEPVELPDDTLAPQASASGRSFRAAPFILLLLAACYGAAEIILPIVVAFVLMLVLQPAVRFLQRWHVPRGLAAALLIVMLFGALGGLGTALSGPAASWAEKVPAGIPQVAGAAALLEQADCRGPATCCPRRKPWFGGKAAGGDGRGQPVVRPAAERHPECGERRSGNHPRTVFPAALGRYVPAPIGRSASPFSRTSGRPSTFPSRSKPIYRPI